MNTATREGRENVSRRMTWVNEMSKEHYISFIAAIKEDGCEMKKLYPEGPAEARFKRSGLRLLYYYCNQHGLFRVGVGTN